MRTYVPKFSFRRNIDINPMRIDSIVVTIYVSKDLSCELFYQNKPKRTQLNFNVFSWRFFHSNSIKRNNYIILKYWSELQEYLDSNKENMWTMPRVRFKHNRIR